jgi:ankyrin repeat protein
VQQLLEKGANLGDRDQNGWTALIWAAEGNHTDVVELLKDARAKAG